MKILLRMSSPSSRSSSVGTGAAAAAQGRSSRAPARPRGHFTLKSHVRFPHVFCDSQHQGTDWKKEIGHTTQLWPSLLFCFLRALRYFKVMAAKYAANTVYVREDGMRKVF